MKAVMCFVATLFVAIGVCVLAVWMQAASLFIFGACVGMVSFGCALVCAGIIE